MSTSIVTQRVTGLAAPICADLGLDLYDVDHAGGTVRVSIDKAGGVDLDTIALVTRLLSRALDAEDPVPGRYTLEVSSPGLERPLRTEAHFRRSVGAEVSVRTRPGAPGPRRLHGVLVAADDDGVVVRVPDDADGIEAGEHRVAYVDVERARTVFRWGPAEPKVKPGKAPVIATRKKAGAS